jgi:sulfane dehydrogenase subunit SoxC
MRRFLPAAGNGLLDRREFLRGGAALAAAMTGYTTAAGAEPLVEQPWSKEPGELVPPYGSPSKYEKAAVRTLSNPKGEPRTQHARTPHHLLQGTATPNPLHFTISHMGNPDIDPRQHKLAIHGLVKRPLLFTLDALERYPLVSRFTFVECGGNSAPLFSPEPIQANVQALHGLSSCAEWTGVKLSTLLEETGVDPKARWVVAEGADAPHLSRSVPLAKILDDAMVALYQNGERIMPGQGYPMRMLLPGWEGNMNVKWLRRLELTALPGMSYYESRTYTPILPNGKAYRFYFVNEVKSFITRPSFGYAMQGRGFYEISGIAYSGNGRITKVQVSADGGKSWAEAALQEPAMAKTFTRFRIPWQWDGGPAVLLSRAWDDTGEAQPTRAEIIAHRGQGSRVVPPTAFISQHYNGPTTWAIDANGGVRHVYV